MTPTVPEKPKRAKRDNGQGSLIPPRLGITRFWTMQISFNGRQIRRSTGITGELINGKWSGKTAAQAKLDELKNNLRNGGSPNGGTSPLVDSSKLYYADLRAALINDYKQQENRSLRTNAITDEPYIDNLKHLDKFFGYTKEGDRGDRVSAITYDRIEGFKTRRQAEGAANATVNRSLASLRRMFAIVNEARVTQRLSPLNTPLLKLLKEPEQPRAGFLEPLDYDRLYNTLPEYVRPLLQLGFYTGMRLGEIRNLKWGRVHLDENAIRLLPADTKNKTGRYIPLIDGLPEMFEQLRRKNPTASENDLVFLTPTGKPIGSFLKAWRNACVKAQIKTTLNGEEIVSHFESDRTYRGLVFHDLRRSAVRNLTEAGVDRTTAKQITGHKTDEVFERYNIRVESDKQDAAVKVAASLEHRRTEAKAKQKNRLRVVEA